MRGARAKDRPPTEAADARITEELRAIFDADWYLEKYPDLRSLKYDPLTHYILHGAGEERDPNRFFDGAWYHDRYPDVAATGYHALLHYLLWGARELRNPHPRFDAAYYAAMHPEAADNPLLYHIRVGASRGWLTEKPIDIRDYLPSQELPASCPDGVMIDVVIAVYRGLQETQDCLASVLADPDRPPGRVIVVEDCSPEPKLVAWLKTLVKAGYITLVHNARNLGFVASVNRGMDAAGTHDVALLNSDTVVPNGWLRRLAAHAYAVPRVASVSPFSNNATICSYPSVSGVSPAFDLDVQAIDTACRTANVGRAVEVPTTVGFCMYIRRAALNDVGPFDTETFGRGYGEENDFCMRATARGWRHMLACDTYVFHEGNVSFGEAATRSKRRGLDALEARYPDYVGVIDRHVQRDDAAPARFAVTAALLRASGKPSVLMISHQLGGGVQRHIDELIERLGAAANVLLLTSSTRGISLSVPALPGHSVFALAGDRLDDLVTYLGTTNLCRVHLHHVLGLDLDVRTLLRRLGLGFDVTVHDYFTICPQVNLLPNPNHQYCGEPGPATCNACIAQRPSHGAHDILSWRRTHTRLLLEAERVLCPSHDVRTRLARYGLARHAVVAPHEPPGDTARIVRPPPLQPGKPLRIALIGVLAGHKGELSVINLAEATPPSEISLHLIGYVERTLAPSVTARLSISGTYAEPELPGLLAAAKPHVVWFPAQWPETYSYTLSAALDAGLPIVATRIGAFPERLEGRALTWLVDPTATTEAWRAVFREVRTALQSKALPAARPREHPRERPRERPEERPTQHRAAPPTALKLAGGGSVADFYARDYAAPLRAPTVRRGEIDLRQPGRVSVLVIPERLENDQLSPCAYIRLLQPLDHPAVAEGIDVVMADVHELSRFRADIVATQRYAIPDIATADALAARCQATGARLLYDIDDDLLHIPRDHPEAEVLRPRARTVARMLRHADAVWVSTPELAVAVQEALPSAQTMMRQMGHPTIRVIPNGLDERLWGTPATETRPRPAPVRLLFMGTATHGGDWAIVAPAMDRVAAAFGPGITFDMIGVLGPEPVPGWVNRMSPSHSGMASYPGFVNWITRQPAWDIGIAPLADTAFNRGKSAIKTLDYAALGLAVLASDVPAYRGSVADDPPAAVGVQGAAAYGVAHGSAGGRLVENTEAAWFRALCELIRNAASRQLVAASARSAFVAHHTIAAQAQARRAAWLDLAPAQPASAASKRRRPARLAAD